MSKRINHILSDQDYKEILTKGFSFLVLRVGGLLAGFLFTFFVAREYGARVVGLVALSFTLIMCLSIFGRLGIDINLIPFYSKEENKSDSGLFIKVLLKSLTFSIGIATALFLLRDVVAIHLFKKPELVPFIYWASLTIPLWTITLVCAGLFRANKRNTLFAFFNNPGRFIISLLVLLAFLWGLNANDLIPIKAHFYAVLTLAIISVITALRQFEQINIKPNSNSWSFLKQAFPMMLSGVIIVFLGWADTFVLGIYEENDTIGIYNVALKIATLTSFSLQAINSILAPKLAKYFNDDNTKEFKKIIRFATKLNFFITLFVVAMILGFHQFILGLYGEEFLSGATVLFILCSGQLINSLSGSVGLIMQMTGLQKTYQNIVLAALVINVTLNFILTPIFGAIGAAVATFVSMAFWNLYSAIYLKRKFNITSYFTLTYKTE